MTPWLNPKQSRICLKTNVSSEGNVYFSWFWASDGDVHFAGNGVWSLGPHHSILTGLALRIIMGPMLFSRWNPRKESFRKLWGPRKRGMARLEPVETGMARLEPWEGGVARTKQWPNSCKIVWDFIQKKCCVNISLQRIPLNLSISMR